MKNTISKILLSALSVLFLSWLLSGISVGESYLYAIFVAIVLALLNNYLKPILVVLTLPATILSLGLFMWVINAGMILLAGAILPGFEVNNFWWALLFSALFSAVNSMLYGIFLPKEERTISFKRNVKIDTGESRTTVTGNKVKVENGKKTIIIEKD